MKIAYLIIVHTDELKLRRLVYSLTTADTGFFVHVDKKVNITPFKNSCKYFDNVFFIEENRIGVNWGGYSMCLAEKELIRMALQSDVNYDRFVLLSGLDYPLYSNQQITNELRIHPQREYMKGYNLTLIKQPIKIPHRVMVYHFRDLSLHNATLNRIVISILMRLMTLLPLKKKNFICCNGKRLDVYGGSQWWILTRRCVEYIYKEMDTNTTLCNYFKTSMAPDELMVQTIVFNSPFKHFAQCFEQNGIYPGLEKTTTTHYIEYAGAQKVFDENDFDTLMNSGKMFCRKTLTGISDRLMDLIDKVRGVYWV